MAHRAEAQKLSGITEAQQRGLALGRQKGKNHRKGYRHKESSKRKCAASHRAYWKAHPEQAKARGAKTRGPLHYKWKGGASRLNMAVRRMTEHRRWSEAVRERDGKCTSCGSMSDLEAHHVTDLAALISEHGIKSTQDARQCEALWDASNGLTLCQGCHAEKHGRKYSARGEGRRQHGDNRNRKDLRQNARRAEGAI